VSVEDSMFETEFGYGKEEFQERYMSERIQISNLYAFALYSHSKWIQEAIETTPFLLLRNKGANETRSKCTRWQI
jgi:hypothetical protein